MKNFKSIMATIAAATMLFSLTACQNNASVDVDRDVTVAATTESTIATTENTNETISVELSTTTATESTTIAVTNSKGETVKATKADNAVVKTTTKKSSSNNSSYKAPATTKKTSSGSSSNKTQATTKKSSSSAKPQTTTKKSTSSNNTAKTTTKAAETRAYNRLDKCYINGSTTKTVFTYEDGTKTVGYFEGGHGDATFTKISGVSGKVADYHEIDPNCPNCHRPSGNGTNGTCRMNCTFQAVKCEQCGENIPPWSCHSCSK